jgi:hypothetical protein
VKFARQRPAAPEAAGYHHAARELLDRWHQATAPEDLDAVR